MCLLRNVLSCSLIIANEPHHETTCLQGFQLGQTETGLPNHRRWQEARNFEFRMYRNCTIYVAKTKMHISCAVTVQLIRAFVFANTKSRFLMRQLKYSLTLLYSNTAKFFRDTIQQVDFCFIVSLCLFFR